MVLSNFVAARWAAANRIPIIYRVQPQVGGGDMASMRPRAVAASGISRRKSVSTFYAQLSSPIRR